MRSWSIRLPLVLFCFMLFGSTASAYEPRAPELACSFCHDGSVSGSYPEMEIQAAAVQTFGVRALTAAIASASWSPGEKVADGSTRAFLGRAGAKSVAVDSNGDVHAVWSEVEPFLVNGVLRNTSETYHAVRSGGVWSPKTRISESDGKNAMFAACAADGQGNVYVVWDDYKYSTNTMLPKPEIMMSVCVGTECDAPRLVSATSPGVYSSWVASVAVDGSDRLWVLWQDRRVDQTYRVFVADQYGEVDVLAIGEGPSVAAAGTAVVAAWQAGPGIVARDLVSGSTATLATSGSAPSVAVNEDGIGYALWNGSSGVQYARLEGGTWSPAAWAFAGGSYASVIADRCGQAHAVYADNAAALRYSVLDGSSWSTAPPLWTSAQSPAIAIDGRSAAPGGLHVVWIDYVSATDAEVYYAAMPRCDENVPPVAAAGPDQVIEVVGSLVGLDGTQSYDEDGDPLAYAWTITERPAGSSAELSDPTSPTPVFTADVHGDYDIALIVFDGALASAPDSVTVSFRNVAPVADPGTNLTVLAGETVQLDGGGSSDANGDALAYSWSLLSFPEGSLAVLTAPSSQQTAFLADLPGTYVAGLVVNDGFVDSLPASISVLAIRRLDAVTAKLMELVAAINALPDSAFRNANMRNALTNKVGAALQMLEAGAFQGARQKLLGDLLPKFDGCAVSGAEDATDWIGSCDSQASVCPIALAAAEILLGM